VGKRIEEHKSFEFDPCFKIVGESGQKDRRARKSGQKDFLQRTNIQIPVMILQI